MSIYFNASQTDILELFERLGAEIKGSDIFWEGGHWVATGSDSEVGIDCILTTITHHRVKRETAIGRLIGAHLEFPFDDAEVIKLSEKDYELLISVLEKPPEPNERLKKAIAAYKTLTPEEKKQEQEVFEMLTAEGYKSDLTEEKKKEFQQIARDTIKIKGLKRKDTDT